MSRSEGVKKSLAKVTYEEMEKHAGQVIAVGMNGEGIIASAPTREELGKKVVAEFGENCQFISLPSTVKKPDPTTG